VAATLAIAGSVSLLGAAASGWGQPPPKPTAVPPPGSASGHEGPAAGATGAAGASKGLTYVALGDSVSSGEGIDYGWHWGTGVYGFGFADYWLGPATWYPQWSTANPAGVSPSQVFACHRSDQAFPNLVALSLHATRFANFACSGATSTEGLLGPQKDYSIDKADPTPAQLGPAYERLHPQAVSVSIGANDIGFSSAVAACYSSPQPGHTSCEKDKALLDRIDQKLEALKGNLRRVLNTINSYGKLSPNGVPKVAIIQYYDPFPPVYTTSCLDIVPYTTQLGNWFAGVTKQQVDLMQSYERKLNDIIAEAARNYPNVHVVDTAPAFNGHRWCSNDPWIYGPQIRAGTYPLITKNSNPAPFHPTPAGQKAIANLVSATLAKALQRG
jgi:lysophospholipase L1-like esterase